MLQNLKVTDGKLQNSKVTINIQVKFCRFYADTEPLPQPEIAAGRPTAGEERRGGQGALYKPAPGAPCGFQIPSCDGRTISSFSD